MMDANSDNGTLTDARWMAQQLRGDLLKLEANDASQDSDARFSRPFLVHQILLTAGKLSRLLKSLKAGGADSRGFVEEQSELLVRVRKVLSAQPALLEEVLKTLDPRDFAIGVEDFLRSAAPTPSPRSSDNEQDDWDDELTEEAYLLLIARDRLELLIEGAREVWGVAASDRLGEVRAALKQVDDDLRDRLHLFARARPRLVRYRRRFGAGSSPADFWWWHEKLPAPRALWQRAAAELRGRGETVWERVAEIGGRAAVLGEPVVAQLRQLLATGWSPQPLLADTGPELRVSLLDEQGEPQGTISSRIGHGPVVHRGRFELRLILGAAPPAGSRALVVADLGGVGVHAILGRMVDAAVEFDQAIDVDQDVSVDSTRLEVAIVAPPSAQVSSNEEPETSS